MFGHNVSIQHVSVDRGSGLPANPRRCLFQCASTCTERAGQGTRGSVVGCRASGRSVSEPTESGRGKRKRRQDGLQHQLQQSGKQGDNQRSVGAGLGSQHGLRGRIQAIPGGGGACVTSSHAGTGQRKFSQVGGGLRGGCYCRRTRATLAQRKGEPGSGCMCLGLDDREGITRCMPGCPLRELAALQQRLF